MVTLLLVLVPPAVRSDIVGVVVASCLNDVVVARYSGDVGWQCTCSRGGYTAGESGKAVEMHFRENGWWIARAWRQSKSLFEVGLCKAALVQ